MANVNSGIDGEGTPSLGVTHGKDWLCIDFVGTPSCLCH